MLTDNAVIPTEKLRDYLLSSSHSVDRFKAVFFRALGYADGDATVEQTDYGQKLDVRGSITGSADRNAGILTAWIIRKESIPRFITAYPGD